MNGRRVRLSVSDSMTFNLTRFVIKNDGHAGRRVKKAM
jgi:hypothetical protein